MVKLLSKTRHITEKILDFAAYTIEVGITAIDAKPGEIDMMIDDRIQRLLGTDTKNKKPKTRHRNTPSKAQIYKELGEEHDAKVEMAAFLEDRLASEPIKKQRMMERIIELERIQEINTELDFER